MRLAPASLALVVLLLTACASDPAAPPPSQPGAQPPILASTSYRGRGAPFGRSDSAEGFLVLQGIASDPGYGHTQQNPVRLGGPLIEGPRREKAYLNGLRGPAGEVIEYERIGSCCPFETPNGMMGGGLLDAFRVSFAGQKAPVTLYINFYDSGPVMVPVGFSARPANP